MSTQSLFISLFQYKAWADRILCEALSARRHEVLEQDGKALRIVHHAHIVDRIFAAHLQAKPHRYASNEPLEIPNMDDLFAEIRDTDHWYVNYVSALSPKALEQAITFRFTDGKPGRMSREEILAHVIAHGGYHRGEIGRLLPQISDVTSGDVFAGYLHRFEPLRKESRKEADSAAGDAHSSALEVTPWPSSP